ncbi:MAG TPA: Mrp/NBP35 family ATP-binding protein [Rhizomicrobium sp.]|jgi:ATP-binding protein involved in chromosome partitioning|nr:Mrp/NBP35 family ATP-binding protein [Rhizomicrobium sp.]
MAVTKDDVLKALSRVADPATGRNVVDADMVQGLVLKGGNVSFAIEVAPERGRAAEPLRQACEEAVARVPGVLSVSAVLTAHQESRAPATPAHAPHGGHAPHGQAPQRMGIPGVESVIAVASGKGGVGKSTVAVNLALALSQLGMKVGLLDADIYGPSVPRLLGINRKPVSDGQKLQPIEKFGLKAMSIGFLVGEESPLVWRGPMVQSALTQMMNDVAWAPLDVLVLDMPPGTGDAQLTIAQRVPLKGAVIVSTPQDIALIDARKGLQMFRKTEVPVLGIVENMSVFVCPHCGEASHIFGHGGARETAEQLDAPFLGEIPLVPAIRETSDAGTPIVALAPQSAEAQAFLAVAKQVAEKIAAPARPAPRIVIE